MVHARGSGFSGMEWWTGMLEWNGGMEWWNGMVEWNGGMEWCNRMLAYRLVYINLRIRSSV